MSQPAPWLLAVAIAPKLAGLQWAIGGSVLLYCLGIETAPRDLDIVTTLEHFCEVDQRLSYLVGTGFRPGHPSYRSTYFKRFTALSGVTIDVMAGINAIVDGRINTWHFHHQDVEYRKGLPLMRAEAWVDLYALFQRPTRVAQLKRFLAGNEVNAQQWP